MLLCTGVMVRRDAVGRVKLFVEVVGAGPKGWRLVFDEDVKRFDDPFAHYIDAATISKLPVSEVR